MITAEEMQAHLVEKSSADHEFRRQLIEDPKSVLIQEFGIEIPDSMKITVHENTVEDVHLALPAKNELTVEQLEAVCAGLTCCGC